MTNKTAQQPTIDVKHREIQDMLGKTLTQLNTMMQQSKSSLDNAMKQMNNMVNDLSKQINVKIQEIKGPVVRVQNMSQVSTKQSSYNIDEMKIVLSVRDEDSAFAKKRKKKDLHLSPRDKDDNENLPDFWRKNYDYGESPYSHLDEIKTITDKVKK